MKHFIVSLVVTAFFVSFGLNAKTLSPAGKTTAAGDKLQLATLQIPFVKNVGQADADVAFYADTFGGAVVVKKDGELELVVPLKKKAGHALIGEAFVDATIKAIKGTYPAVTKVSYFLGNDPEDWYSNIPTYEAISLGNVYNGIELKLKAYGNNVEKLFYVSPGADPALIRVKVSGTRSVEVTEDGFLELETNDCIVHYSTPEAYQIIDGEKRTVEVAYRVTGDTYSFELGDYDTSKELVIDPLLQSTYFGGSGGDAVLGLGIAPNGSVYAVGRTSSTDISGFSSPLDGTDAFVARFNHSLTILQGVAYIGGTASSGGPDEARAVAFRVTDSQIFDVYVAGQTFSSDLAGISIIDSADSTFGATAGESEGFVSWLDSELTTLKRSTYFGGASPAPGETLPADAVDAMFVPTTGDIFIAGMTVSNDLPGIILASSQPDHGGGPKDGFIARLAADLTGITASTYLGGSGEDEVRDLFLSGAHVFVAGHTDSNETTFPGITANSSYQDTLAGGFDVFVTKISPDLTGITASTYLGGSSVDKLQAIADTGSDILYLAGTTSSVNFPLGDPAKAAFSVQQESFIAYIQKDLTTASAYQGTYLGGNGDDVIEDLALLTATVAFNMSTDSVYIAGTTSSDNFPGTIGGDDEVANDVFVMRIDATLSDTATYQSTYLGGSGANDSSDAIAADLNYGIFVGGTTDSTDFKGSTDGADTDNSGSGDGFVANFDLSLKYISTAEIHVAPTILPIDFGEVFNGETSDAVAITINNFASAGGDDLIISDIVLSNTTDYLLEETGTDNACGSASVSYIVKATEQCLVWVTFTPKSGSADPFDATLTISSNDFDEPEFAVTLTGTGGSDSDGVPDSEEQGPDGSDPGYNGNSDSGDSTPDRLQSSVVSMHNHNDSFYVTLEASSGPNSAPANLENVTIAGIPSTQDLPDNLQAPYGYYSFGISGLTDNTATVRLILRSLPSSALSGDEEPDGYWKYGPQTLGGQQSWYEFAFDGATGAEISLNQGTQFYEVKLNYIDGLRGDHDLTQNGRIDDPGAPVKVKTVTVAPAVDDGSSGLCFIATAAYGSYMHDDVKVLRDFRDDYLLTNGPGRKFVSAYYQYSPPIADYIGADETRRMAARWLLTPLVYAIKYPYMSLLLMLAAGLMVSVYRQRVQMKQLG